MTYVGIDVSQAMLDWAIHGGAIQQVPNDPAGHAALITALQAAFAAE